MSVSDLRRMGVIFYAMRYLQYAATSSLLLRNEIGQVEMRTKRDISTMLYERNRRREAVAGPTTTSLPTRCSNVSSTNLEWEGGNLSIEQEAGLSVATVGHESGIGVIGLKSAACTQSTIPRPSHHKRNARAIPVAMDVSCSGWADWPKPGPGMIGYDGRRGGLEARRRSGRVGALPPGPSFRSDPICPALRGLGDLAPEHPIAMCVSCSG
jgi:hypothetical protein